MICNIGEGEICEGCNKKIRWYHNSCMFSPSGDTQLHFYHSKCATKTQESQS